MAAAERSACVMTPRPGTSVTCDPWSEALATGDEADLRGAGSSPQAMSLALGPSLGAEAGVVVHEHPTLFHRGILAPSPWRHNRADPIHDVRGGPDGSDEPAT